MQDGAASLETFYYKYLYGVYQLLMYFVHGWTSAPLACKTCYIPRLGKQLAVQE